MSLTRRKPVPSLPASPAPGVSFAEPRVSKNSIGNGGAESDRNEHWRSAPGSQLDVDVAVFEIVQRVSLQSCKPQRSTSLKVLRSSPDRGGHGERPRRGSQPSRYPPSGFQGKEALSTALTSTASGWAGIGPLDWTPSSAVEESEFEAVSPSDDHGTEGQPPSPSHTPYGIITPPNSASNLSPQPERPRRSSLRLPRNPTAQTSQPLTPRPSKRRITTLPSSGALTYESIPIANGNRRTADNWDSAVLDPLGEGERGGSRWHEGTYPLPNHGKMETPSPPSERIESGPLLASRSRSNSIGNRLSLPALAREESVVKSIPILPLSEYEYEKKEKPSSRAAISMSLVRPGTFDDGVRFGTLAESHAYFVGGPALFFPRIVNMSRDKYLPSRFVIEARSWGALLKVIGAYGSTTFATCNEDSGVETPGFSEAALTLQFLPDVDGVPLIRLAIFLPLNLLSLSQDLTVHTSKFPVSHQVFSLPTHPIFPFALGSLAGPLGSMRHFADLASSSTPAAEPSPSYLAMRSFYTALQTLEKPVVPEVRKVGKLRRLMRSKSLKVVR